MGSSVASFLVLGVPTENFNLYARASASKTYIQVSKYICIHTINAVPSYYSGMAPVYDSRPIMLKPYIIILIEKNL